MARNPAATRITNRTLKTGLTYLKEKDPDLARILEKLGPPPIWDREPGFPTLLLIILEQQVSLASARAAYNRLVAASGELTPARLLTFDDVQLKQFGFSRQKTAYARHLAESILDGRLDLASVHSADDESARIELLKLKGVGHWTIDIYLLMALGRPDIWPVGDLALASALQHAKGLGTRPSLVEMQNIAEEWRPWRAVAARLLWHYYLSAEFPRRRKNRTANS